MFEKEQADAQNTLIKIKQDIDVFNAKRSKLQNEIEAREQESRDKIAAEYAEHQKKMQEQRAALDKQVKETNALLGRTEANIAAQNEEIRGEWETLGKEKADFDKERADFNEYIKAEKKKLEDRAAVLSKQAEGLSLRNQELDKIAKAQSDYKYTLDNLKFQADYSIGENRKLLEEITAQQNGIGQKLQAIKSEKAGIVEEKNIILAKLSELNEQEEELRKLESLKGDIAKLETLKVETEALLKKNEELSKSAANKKTELDERESSLDEKQKLLVIDMRKNDEKIKTIQRLREELKNLQTPV